MRMYRRVFPALVTILLCAGLFFAGYVFDISPLNKSRHQALQQHTNLEQQLELLSRQQLSLEEKQSRFSEVEQSLLESEDKLIKPDDLQALLKEIRRTTVADQLTVTTLTLGEEKLGKYYSEVPIYLMVSGSFDQAAKLIADIAALPWLVVVQDFTVLKWDENVSMKLILKIYHVT